MPKLLKHTSWRLMLAVAVFVLGSIASLVSPTLIGTAQAEVVDNPTAYDCYLEFNSLAVTAYNPAFSETTASGRMWKKCQDSGYCTVSTISQGVGLVDCKTALTNQVNNDDILNAQIAPIITLVCGSASTNSSADQAFADCSSKVKTQYKVCQDAALNHSDSDVAGSIASCMSSWVKSTYPDKKIEPNKMTAAVKEGITKGTDKATEINKKNAEEAKAACEAKGMDYDPSSQSADKDGCVAKVSTDTAACTGGVLGWILCPLVTISTEAIKVVAPWLEKQLMVQPMTSGASQTIAIQAVWQIIVGIANLLLVVAFLVVIFSQATSLGLSAYGIKKMLPRIIAAAILINLSFFLCSVLIDIFNVIGGAVKGIIDAGIAALASGAKITAPTDYADLASATMTWIAAAVATAAVGLLGYVVPLLVAGALAALGMMIMIGMRQVLILLLIALAPLAFAAMVLPGTESLFKKWGKSFIGLLAMYPVIMAILYGCSLISMIILASAGAAQ